MLSFEQAVAAPLCTARLADSGARVIKIERKGTGDFARNYDKFVKGRTSSYFSWLNRGKVITGLLRSLQFAKRSKFLMGASFCRAARSRNVSCVKSRAVDSVPQRFTCTLCVYVCVSCVSFSVSVTFQESLSCDIKDADDCALIHRMLSKADVFVQNFAPGACARAGFGSAELRERHPHLITVIRVVYHICMNMPVQCDLNKRNPSVDPLNMKML